MSENSSPPEQIAQSDKPSAKHRWRGKLFSGEGWRGRDEEKGKSSEEELAHFLSGSKLESTFKDEAQTPFAGAPRLDTSARTQRQVVAAIESDLGPVRDYYRRPRPPLKKGLSVGFVGEAPVIIGEGGDDAELPVVELLNAMKQFKLDGSMNPQTLRRRSTSHTSPAPSKLAHQEALDFRRQVRDKEERTEASNTKSASTKQSQPARALSAEQSSENASPPPSSTRRRPTANHLHPSLPSIAQVDARKSPSPDLTLRTENSLTPSPSSQPLNRCPEPPDQKLPSNTVQSLPQEARRRSPAKQESPELEARSDRTVDKPTSKLANLRKAAHALGDNALDEFDSAVSSLHQTFHRNVATHRDMMKVPFSSWIRIAAWWFLRGRQELESAVREGIGKGKNDGRIDDSGRSRKLMQAYVDLSKSWWIVKEITPKHAEIQSYGNAGMTSMAAIVQSFGDSELAELVEIHIAIIANLRALTISMKRNNRLPPLPFEIHGSDTHVITEYPNLPRSITNLNTAFQNNAMSQVGFQMPINDTNKIFALARMFAKCSLVSQLNGGENFRMQCLVSLVQNKTDGGLQAMIATQDGQVNAVVESDERKKPSVRWKDIQWAKSSHSLIVALAQDQHLQMVFSEKDFGTLDHIYDGHANAQRLYRPLTNEIMAFECLLRQFERLETPSEPRSFPQGTLLACKLRLFVKTKNDAGLQSHGGFRLAVVTPPNIKNFRALSVDLGGERPILMAPWQVGDRLNMTLRSPDCARLLIGFNSPEELDSFQLVVRATGVTNSDSMSPMIRLQDFDIKLTQEDIVLNVHQEVYLKSMKWQKLRFVGCQPQNPDRLSAFSAGTRMVIRSGLGTLVDRLQSSKTLNLPGAGTLYADLLHRPWEYPDCFGRG